MHARCMPSHLSKKKKDNNNNNLNKGSTCKKIETASSYVASVTGINIQVKVATNDLA